MRLGHFEALQPICPRCRADHGRAAALELHDVREEQHDDIRFGRLICSASECLLEYPIVDGIPLLFADIRRYVADNLAHLTARQDLPDYLESLAGDCVGPGTLFDATRQHLSTYAWDHYGEFDQDAPTAAGAGAVVRCLDAGLSLLQAPVEAPVLDAGCGAGRTCFELAERCDGLVLGVDANFSLLQLARRVLTDGRATYPRRRIGIVYDRADFTYRSSSSDRVDFWACDVHAPPFRHAVFATAVGLNVLDCLASPRDALQALADVLAPGGQALIATPYDWSVNVTPLESWIGGHSQRGPGGGAAEPLLRSLLTPGAHAQAVEGLQIQGEIDAFPWHTRIHARSRTAYEVHVTALVRTEVPGPR